MGAQGLAAGLNTISSLGSRVLEDRRKSQNEDQKERQRFKQRLLEAGIKSGQLTIDPQGNVQEAPKPAPVTAPEGLEPSSFKIGPGGVTQTFSRPRVTGLQSVDDVNGINSLLEGISQGGFQTVPSANAASKNTSQFFVGQILTLPNGQKVRITGFDTDGEPLVDPF